MEPKMGVLWPQPRIVWSTRSWKRQEGASPRASKGSTASPHLHLDLLASSTEREYMSVVLRHLVCGHLLPPPQEVNTPTVQAGLAAD